MLNIPNLLTALRLLLAVVFFTLISFHSSDAICGALIVFVLATVTDLLDGYVARKYDSLTDLGRIADPFVDKVLICGALIIFLRNERLAEAGLAPWMIVIVVAREFFVNSLRGFAEGKGVKFGATILGKSKMLFQCLAVCASLGYLLVSHPSHAAALMLYATYILMVVTTLGSGLIYLKKAVTEGLLEHGPDASSA